MDSISSPSEPRVAGVTDLPRSRPGAKVTGEQFINEAGVARGIVTLELGDAAALPWRDGTFTLVLSSNTFFFFTSPLNVLAEMHRVLVAGGRLAVATVPGPEAPLALARKGQP